jgi:hypothetical protein
MTMVMMPLIERTKKKSTILSDIFRMSAERQAFLNGNELPSAALE